jgi:hypothetical protein
MRGSADKPKAYDGLTICLVARHAVGALGQGSHGPTSLAEWGPEATRPATGYLSQGKHRTLIGEEECRATGPGQELHSPVNLTTIELEAQREVAETMRQRRRRLNPQGRALQSFAPDVRSSSELAIADDQHHG